jgi:cell division protein FtsL
MKIMIKIIAVLILVTAVLEIGNIYLSNIQAVGGIDASKLQMEIASVAEENGNLETDVMQLSSLEMVASRAAELGFTETKEVITLTPQQLAFKK